VPKRQSNTRTVGSATWDATHVSSTVSTTVLSDPLLM
jgi:hypothetical protein